MAETTATAQTGARVGYFRWVVCGLLFLGTTVNYVDRQVLGLLAPDLRRIIGWNDVEYGYIVTAFSGAYAIGLLLSGRLLDRIGTKLGYAAALVFWSVAAMAHALARTPFGFGAARFALGLGEAANFPAAIKSVAEWFPKKERAFATGIFNAGTNVGALVAPLVVPWLALTFSLAVGVHHDGRLRLQLADPVVLALRPAREEPLPDEAGVRLHPQRPGGAAGRGPVAEPRAPPPDLGLRARQVHDRPDLVVLPVLGPELPQPEVRRHAPEDGSAARRDLPDRRRRLDRRGLALVGADQARLGDQPRAQDDHAVHGRCA